MRPRRRTEVGGVLVLVAILGHLFLMHRPDAHAADFYSWIDPNGSVVLTDDLSGLPPNLPRQSVWTYRYADPPPNRIQATPHRSMAPPQAEAPPPPTPKPASDPPPAAVQATDSPAVSDAPTGQVAVGQALVLGVPLAPPLYAGGQSLPLALLQRLPPGPEGLAQRLRELQALQARHFAAAAPPQPGKALRQAAGRTRGAR